MKRRLFVTLLLVTGFLIGPALLSQTPQKYPDYPSETPDNFKPTDNGFEYERRDVMIPMRDGVKLHTVILVPNGAKNAPILLTRTPYNASGTYDAYRKARILVRRCTITTTFSAFTTTPPT